MRQTSVQIRAIAVAVRPMWAVAMTTLRAPQCVPLLEGALWTALKHADKQTMVGLENCHSYAVYTLCISLCISLSLPFEPKLTPLSSQWKFGEL